MSVQVSKRRRHLGKLGKAFRCLDKGMSRAEMKVAVPLDWKTADVYWRRWRKERGEDGRR